MRDIVERLELQAFVAEKIQSGMKPLIMDCLEEITRLRVENDMQQATILVPSQKDDQRRIERLDAALKEALDEAAALRAENKKLREALKPFAYYALQIPDDVSDTASASGTVGDLRAAAAALKESGDE